LTLGFVDTSAWIALITTTDPDHPSARSFYRNLGRRDRLLTTHYVVAETLTWLRYHVSHAAALRMQALIEATERTNLVEIHWVMPETHDRGFEVFRHYRDQVLSLTDCTSAVVARDSRVDYVFSFDSDFSVLGFDVRPSP
jgi:predicted nucleic acid-binding protein